MKHLKNCLYGFFAVAMIGFILACADYLAVAFIDPIIKYLFQ